MNWCPPTARRERERAFQMISLHRTGVRLLLDAVFVRAHKNRCTDPHFFLSSCAFVSIFTSLLHSHCQFLMRCCSKSNLSLLQVSLNWLHSREQSTLTQQHERHEKIEQPEWEVQECVSLSLLLIFFLLLHLTYHQAPSLGKPHHSHILHILSPFFHVAWHIEYVISTQLVDIPLFVSPRETITVNFTSHTRCRCSPHRVIFDASTAPIKTIDHLAQRANYKWNYCKLLIFFLSLSSPE